MGRKLGNSAIERVMTDFRERKLYNDFMTGKIVMAINPKDYGVDFATLYDQLGDADIDFQKVGIFIVIWSRLYNGVKPKKTYEKH